MKQIKVFKGGTLSDVQDKVNKWINEQYNYKIISISNIREISSSFSFYCSIVYKKKKK